MIFPRKDTNALLERRLLFFSKDEDRNAATNFPEEVERREEDEDNIFLFLW